MCVCVSEQGVMERMKESENPPVMCSHFFVWVLSLLGVGDLFRATPASLLLLLPLMQN